MKSSMEFKMFKKQIILKNGNKKSFCFSFLQRLDYENHSKFSIWKFILINNRWVHIPCHIKGHTNYLNSAVFFFAFCHKVVQHIANWPVTHYTHNNTL